MATFNLTVQRIEHWHTDITVEADTLEEAIKQTDEALSEHGWDEVCGDDEGDYIECYSTVLSGQATAG